MEFKLNRLSDYSDDEILKELKRVAEYLGVKPLLIDKFNIESRVSASTIIHRFGSWQRAIILAGLDKSYAARVSVNISREEILTELQRVAKILNKDCFTQNEFTQQSIFGIGYRGFKREFGGFQNAMKEAGLKVSLIGARYNEDECFQNLLKVWTHYGRQPFYGEMKNHPSLIGPKSYINKWGSWSKSLEAFINYINSEEQLQNETEKKLDDSEVKIEVGKNNYTVTHKTQRNVNWRLRFLVMRRDKFKCVIDGRSPATHTSITLVVDHIIPWAKGGETVFDNLQTLCSVCNGGKSNLDMY